MNSCCRPSVRYGHQSEVMEQKRLLTAANEDLQKQISELKVKLITVLMTLTLALCIFLWSQILFIFKLLPFSDEDIH